MERSSTPALRGRRNGSRKSEPDRDSPEVDVSPALSRKNKCVGLHSSDSDGKFETQQDPLLAQKLNEVLQKADAAYEQLQERFTAEYKTLLQTAVNDGVTVKNDRSGSSIPVRVNHSLSSQNSQEKVTEKTFIIRDSVLTEILKISHVRSVYNIFAAVLIMFGIQTVVHDYFDTGRVVMDFELIYWGIGRFPYALVIWLFLMAYNAALYPIFTWWIHLRSTNNQKVIDILFLGLYIVCQLMSLALPVWGLVRFELRPISSFFVTAEQVRLLMKGHSFIRENAPRALYPEKRSLEGLDFSRYLYFLFAPTLIYRDQYPRSPKVNWWSAAFNFAQVVMCIFYTYYVFMRFCIPNFHSYNHEYVTVKTYVLAWFGCMMPSVLLLVIAFYGILHCWLNAWAEVLRFGDRLFYKDWWNATDFLGYYRNWNLVVHEWLYTYVYQDIFWVMGRRRSLRFMAMYATFITSAVFHEYIIISAMRFFYPVMFVVFGVIGVSLIYVRPRYNDITSNIYLWLTLFAGNGALMFLYSAEYYSRVNCPPIHPGEFADYFTPRSWYCASS